MDKVKRWIGIVRNDIESVPVSLIALLGTAIYVSTHEQKANSVHKMVKWF